MHACIYLYDVIDEALQEAAQKQRRLDALEKTEQLSPRRSIAVAATPTTSSIGIGVSSPRVTTTDVGVGVDAGAGASPKNGSIATIPSSPDTFKEMVILHLEPF